MSYNPQYPYTRDELSFRQIRTSNRVTRRATSSAKATADESAIYLRMMQLDSPWNNYGKLYLLRVPNGTDAIPAIGSALKLRNRESGIDLGVWRIIPATEGDDFYGHPLSVWELCSTSDHRADGSKNTPQNGTQSIMAPVTPAVPV